MSAVRASNVIVLCGLSVAVLVATSPMATAVASAAATAAQSGGTSQSRPADRLYCGIRSLYAAIRYEGGTTNFSTFLRRQYVGSAHGSSLEELENAAREAGYYAVPISNIQEPFLANLTYPTILHVKKSYSSDSYDHYILCLRTLPEGIRIFDPPDRVETISIARVLGQTDGLGLVVSTNPDTVAELLRSRVERMAVGASILFITLVVMRGIGRRTGGIESTTWRRSIATAMLLAFFGGSLGIAYNAACNGGLVARSVQNRDVVTPDVEAPVIERQDVTKLLEKGSAILVDARTEADFNAGHISGAVNIPVGSSETERNEIMQGVPRDALVIVYCQSSDCPYSRQVASGLKSDGFFNLVIYRGGWLDWKQAPEANGRG